MIITKTPFRISFFGGGTDYPAWYKENGGAVVATTIDKYCYITCRKLPPFFEHRHRIVYSVIENVAGVGEILHPAVREVFRWANITEGLEIHHDGDLPARSGLGSSSAFTVGLVLALKALAGEQISKSDLARSAIHIEQDLIKENVGSQDQVSAAVGGLNRIDFLTSGDFVTSPVIMNEQRRSELGSHLMLFFTGFTRIASEIAEHQVRNLPERRYELETMREMVDVAISLLADRHAPLMEFGKLLDEGWRLKQRLSDRVSTPAIDEIYEAAKKAGATGGKILGAGGGGFLLLFVHPERQPAVRDALSKLVHVPFKFENAGASVALYQPDGL